MFYLMIYITFHSNKNSKEYTSFCYAMHLVLRLKKYKTKDVAFDAYLLHWQQ